MYLCAVIDWHSRAVLAWELSNTLDAGFCVQAVARAMAEYDVPEIFNTDQGCQFTSAEFTEPLLARGVKISMDGRGRAFDNVFVDQLWRTVKYHEVYLKGYCSQIDAYTNLDTYFRFYNEQRPHSAFGTAEPEPDGSLPPARSACHQPMTSHQSVRRRADSCGKLYAPVLGVGQGIQSAFVSHN